LPGKKHSSLQGPFILCKGNEVLWIQPQDCRLLGCGLLALLVKVRTRWKYLPRWNTLAYFTTTSVTKKKSFKEGPFLVLVAKSWNCIRAYWVSRLNVVRTKVIAKVWSKTDLKNFNEIANQFLRIWVNI